MKNINPIAIILARGGSKEIKNKNLVTINDRSLLEITINQIKKELDIHIFVSSDSEEILDVATLHGCQVIKRSTELSSDTSTSEDALIHGIDFIEKNTEVGFNTLIFPQLTSPLRKYSDFPKALSEFSTNNWDSLFSSNLASDLLLWKENKDGKLEEMNFENNNRILRQSKELQLVENGSFYIFDRSLFNKYKTRLFGKIGYFKMEPWQIFEIDSYEELELCKQISKIKNVDGIY